jgi:hypothetical protein
VVKILGDFEVFSEKGFKGYAAFLSKLWEQNKNISQNLGSPEIREFFKILFLSHSKHTSLPSR